jgi:excisionase family DNA binding protein
MSVDSQPPVLTIDEVAVLLRVNRKTAYGLARRGKLPGCRRVGRCLRVHRDTLLAWLGAEHPHRQE